MSTNAPNIDFMKPVTVYNRVFMYWEQSISPVFSENAQETKTYAPETKTYPQKTETYIVSSRNGFLN